MRRARVEQAISEAVTEARSVAYSDAVIATMMANAAGTIGANIANTGAAEIASRFVSFGLAHAEVEGDHIDACVLADIGRDLVRDGHSIWRPRPTWWRSCGYDVFGPADPAQWTYRLDFPAPSQGLASHHYNSSGVANFRWSTDPARPWAGISPLAGSGTAGVLLARLEASLASELNAKVGRLLAVPEGIAEEAMTTLRSDMAKLNGQVALIETTAAGHGAGAAAAPRRDWESTRIGADPPEVLCKLHQQLTEEVLLTVLPVGLVRVSDGSAMRESFRQFTAMTLRPIAKLISAECERVGLNVALDFEGLRSDDVQGRARAFSAMVKAGMSPKDAADNAGLNVTAPDTAVGG